MLGLGHGDPGGHESGRRTRMLISDTKSNLLTTFPTPSKPFSSSSAPAAYLILLPADRHATIDNRIRKASCQNPGAGHDDGDDDVVEASGAGVVGLLAVPPAARTPNAPWSQTRKLS